MRALYDRSVEPDHVEQVAEAELAGHQAPPDLEHREGDLRIEEELDRVVAGLQVDVDGAGVVGSTRVIEPKVVAEPAFGARHEHQLTRALVVEPGSVLTSAVEHLLHAVELFA